LLVVARVEQSIPVVVVLADTGLPQERQVEIHLPSLL
jgi:hypothetical protein